MMDPRTQHAMQQMAQVRRLHAASVGRCFKLLCCPVADHSVQRACAALRQCRKSSSLTCRLDPSLLLAPPVWLQAMQELQSTGLFPQLPAGLGGSGLGLGGGAGTGLGAGAGAGGAPPNMDALLGLLGGGAGGLGFGMPPPPANPEEAYASQLQQLQVGGLSLSRVWWSWGAPQEVSTAPCGWHNGAWQRSPCGLVGADSPFACHPGTLPLQMCSHPGGAGGEASHEAPPVPD